MPVACWHARTLSGVKGVGLLEVLLHGALPKTGIFSGEPEVFVPVNPSAPESVRNMQGKSSWWPHILGEGPWLLTAAEPGEDYSNCRSVTGFFPCEIPFCCLGPHPLFIQTTQAMPQGLTESVPGSCTPADAWGSSLAAAWVGGRGVEEVCDTCQVAQLQNRRMPFSLPQRKAKSKRCCWWCGKALVSHPLSREV